MGRGRAAEVGCHSLVGTCEDWEKDAKANSTDGVLYKESREVEGARSRHRALLRVP